MEPPRHPRCEWGLGRVGRRDVSLEEAGGSRTMQSLESNGGILLSSLRTRGWSRRVLSCAFWPDIHFVPWDDPEMILL